MSKSCEVCGKKPVVGRQSATPITSASAPLRAEPAGGARLDQRRGPPHPRVHPLPAFEQDHQSRLAMLSAVSSEIRPQGPGAVFSGHPRRTVPVRVGAGAHRSGHRRIGRPGLSPIKPGAHSRTSGKF